MNKILETTALKKLNLLNVTENEFANYQIVNYLFYQLLVYMI